MARIIVFGGAGFVGSHVADALTDAGHNVYVFDIRSSSFLHSNQEMVIGDVLDRQAVGEACKRMDYALNYVGTPVCDKIENCPYPAVQLNIIGTVNILAAANAASLKRVILASDFYVNHRMDSFHRATKRTAERLAEIFFERYHLPYTIIRFSPLYGPRATGAHTTDNMLLSLVEKGHAVWHGEPKEKGRFVHVEAAAKASVKALEDQYSNRYIRIDSGEELSATETTDLVSNLIGKRVRLEIERTQFFSGSGDESHRPMIGKKLVTNPFIDMGQGILDCIHEIDDLHRK